MKIRSLLRLTRLNALPVPKRYREQLRMKEKRTGYYGVWIVILVLIALGFLDLPRMMSAQVFALLSLAFYVSMSVSGRAMVSLLILLAIANVIVAYLPTRFAPSSSAWALLVMFPAFLLTACWTGRLQFVRACGPKYRNWPGND